MNNLTRPPSPGAGHRPTNWPTGSTHGWPRWTDRVQEAYAKSLEAHLVDVVDDAKDNFDIVFGILSYECESPIEALFLAGIMPYVVWDPSYTIERQYPIGDYRADFLVRFSDGDKVLSEVVVECDGHDYHERTKEQAERDKKRDRAMVAAGYTVFRFTGRELHRDPHKCAEEVLDFTQRDLA